MISVFQSGINILGIPVDPALLAFGLAAILFGGLNILEYKRFD